MSAVYKEKFRAEFDIFSWSQFFFFFFHKHTKPCTAGKKLTLYFRLCFLIKMHNSPAQAVVFFLTSIAIDQYMVGNFG